MTLHVTHQTAFPDFCGEIITLLRSNLPPRKLQEQLAAYHEKDIALSLAHLTREEKQRLFRLLTPGALGQVIECAADGAAEISLLGIRQRASVLSRMEASAAAELLQTLPKAERATLLELMDADARREISLIRSFDEDEIGSRMSTNFIALTDTLSVKQAMSELIRQAAENDDLSMLYLVDGTGTFCGAIDLKDLILAREGTALADIATSSYPYLYAKATVEDCLPYLREYAEASIPVLDDANRLIGAVTAKAFAELLGDALNEDYARLAGLSSEEDLAEPVRRSVRKRLPWLCILLVLGLGVSATVGLFESIVAQLPIIMCFQSLVLDMAGNVGTQSLAVAIRVLMDTHLGRRHKAALVGKEARIGLANGAILGLLSFALIGGFLCLKGHAPAFAFSVSACLGLAMLLAMLISALSGTLIPLFFKRIGVDPAVASGPLITTVNDLVAVVAYYGLAWLILVQSGIFAAG